MVKYFLDEKEQPFYSQMLPGMYDKRRIIENPSPQMPCLLHHARHRAELKRSCVQHSPSRTMPTQVMCLAPKLSYC